MAKGKKYTDALEAVRPRAACTRPPRRVDLVKSLASAKFDETVELAVRLGVDPRKADQMVRGTVALPVGHRQGRPGRGVRRRRRPPTEARDAGADIVGADDLAAAGRGRHARLRRRHRHARPHAAGRQARPGARPPRPHAEPQDRHGHHRRGQGRRASSRAARSSTAPTATATSTCRSARSASSRDALLDELPRRARRAQAGQAGLGQGPLLPQGSPSRRRWAPASRSTRQIAEASR